MVTTASIGPEATDVLERLVPLEVASSPDEETMMSLLDDTIGIVCRGEGK